ncbi:MAG: NADH-quinone oxidoreductase subunit C [Ornithinimicrobium sp.]
MSELQSGVQTIRVDFSDWLAEVVASRDAGYDFFDWLSAVDYTGAQGDGTMAESPDGPADAEGQDGDRGDQDEGYADHGRGMLLVLHLIASGSDAPRPLSRLLLQTLLPTGSSVASVTSVFAGAAWHERETHEMFGVEFTGFDDGTGQGLRPLLLPEGFEGEPLRKSFILAARASKPWPGAKEPGESDSTPRPTARRRKRILPPGVPDESWGPRTH